MPGAAGPSAPKTTGAVDNSCSVLTGWEASIQFSCAGIWECLAGFMSSAVSTIRAQGCNWGISGVGKSVAGCFQAGGTQLLPFAGLTETGRKLQQMLGSLRQRDQTAGCRWQSVAGIIDEVTQAVVVTNRRADFPGQRPALGDFGTDHDVIDTQLLLFDVGKSGIRGCIGCLQQLAVFREGDQQHRNAAIAEQGECVGIRRAQTAR